MSNIPLLDSSDLIASLKHELAFAKRELEIEAALEKVRSRSHAMKNTGELREIVKTVFDSLLELDLLIKDGAVSVLIFESGSKDHTQWTAAPDHDFPTAFKVEFSKHSLVTDIIDAWENGSVGYQKIYPFEEKRAFFKYLFIHNPAYKDLPLEVKTLLLDSKEYGYSIAFGQHSALMVATNIGVLLSQEEFEILYRFSRVFDQAYNRFLDLKKAEDQAREAQIQLALERVRARTMAMQRSDELADAATLLFQQIRDLGIKTWTTGFNVWLDGDNAYQDWLTTPEGGFIEPYIVDLTQYPVFKKFREAKLRGDEFYVGFEDKDTIKETYKQLMKFAPDQFGKLLTDGFQFPTEQYDHFVFGKKVSLLFITYEPIPEAHDIFKRFGKVFEQTYTRFLDLQKAEAQAREAQIEAALERIRSRSLAMHNSDELKEVIGSVFERLKDLALDFDAASIQLFKDSSKDSVIWVASPDVISEPLLINLPYDHELLLHSEFFKTVWNSKVRGEDIFNRTYLFNEKNKYYGYVLKYNPQIPESVGEKMLQAKSYTHTVIMEKYSALIADSWYGRTLSIDDYNILKRVAKVFEQAYTRFLDLQKAEAQAREAQIEAALEKIRSRSLSMHRSDELKDVIVVVFEKLKDLGLSFEDSGIQLFREGSRDIVEWVAAPDILSEPVLVNLPYSEEDFKKSEIIRDVWAAKEEGKSIFNKNYSFHEKNLFFEYAGKNNDLTQIPEEAREFQMRASIYTQTLVAEKHSALWVDSYSGQIISSEDFNVLKRFAKVFEQAYTRFLDLQRAEAQAREAQIEAALEKVRSRSLAMHSSTELEQVVGSLFDRLVELDLSFDGAGIFTYDKDKRNMNLWIATTHLAAPARINLPFDKEIENNSIWKDFWHAFENGIDIFHKTYPKQIKNEYFHYVAKYNDIPEQVKRTHMEKTWTAYFVASKHAMVGFDSWTDHHVELESYNVLKRFASVFDQCYTRFLDLQKAEEQAREAQIHLALERVRARTMAMQQSDELAMVSQLLFQQFHALGIQTFTCTYMFIEEEKNLQRCWVIAPDGTLLTDLIDFPLTGDTILNDRYQSWKEKQPIHEVGIHGKLNKQHHRFLASRVPQQFAENIVSQMPDRIFFYSANFSHGYLFIASTNPLSAEEKTITIRFANIFQQTYTRFLDLKKAEGQAKEAKIEAALERVRARAMAMQSSHELKEVAHELRMQIGILGLKDLDTCVIHLYEESPDLVHSWAAMKPPESKDEIQEFQETVPKKGIIIIEEALEAYHSKKKDYVLVNKGSKILQWFAFMEKKSPEAYAKFLESAKGIKPEEIQSYWSCSDFPGGSLLMVTTSHPGEAFRSILRRFANVFGLAYRRFADLKQAEALAREATKQASLDRVRAEIASMRSASDLNMITPLIFNELKIQSIPFIRCGVFVIHEEEALVEAYLSSPEGHSLGVLRLPFHCSELTSRTVDAWRKGTIYRQHWNKVEFTEWIELMMEQDQIQDKRTYQGAAVPPEHLDLHFVPFTQGMLYVGATHSLLDTEIDIVKGLAKAFSIAYSRYEDFVKLEKAKADIEATLSELKATQSQLIQSEKMASLGELTAGIAHEIQNPLNFVNNFSEVSSELMEELKGERLKVKGLRDEAVEEEIIGDVIQNLEKITHHGKRADAIVKGMLEHSRTSSGKKVLTDINALADEYLRLSYHGMRAKDKNFQAEFETHLDPGLPKVNVVPQDIGRVFLNIINNAFQACFNSYNPSSYRENSELKPKVTVSTKKLGDKIQISVKDNGPGIPDAIKDKIFQPFFTTKPTGQGTGLGLSLSYDIVKAHGGTIIINSETGIGTIVTISIPP